MHRGLFPTGDHILISIVKPARSYHHAISISWLSYVEGVNQNSLEDFDRNKAKV